MYVKNISSTMTSPIKRTKTKQKVKRLTAFISVCISSFMMRKDECTIVEDVC